MLADGRADMVSMARPFLADPDFVAKAADGPRRRDQHLHRLQPGLPGPHLQRQDHLAVWSTRAPATRPSWCLARPGAASASPWSAPARPGSPAPSRPPSAGTQVTLFDAADEIGGQFNVATQGPGQGGVRRDAALLPHQLTRTASTCGSSTRVDAPSAAGGGFDEVVLATGVEPAHPRDPRRRPPERGQLPRRPARRRAGRRPRRGHRGGRHRLRRRRVPDRRRRRGSQDPEAYFREWGVDTDYEAPRRPGRTRAPAAAAHASTCCSARRPRSAPVSARPPAGSTAPSCSTAVSRWSRASYDLIDDAGLHVTVDGEAHRAAGRHRGAVRRPGAAPRAVRRSWRRQAAAVHLIGGADVAAELDAKRAINQGTELAAAL